MYSERISDQDTESITPQQLINIRPVIASIKEFFPYISIITIHRPAKLH
ncbi:hypothetical protein ACV56Z_08350 [Staphylococcus aureus]